MDGTTGFLNLSGQVLLVDLLLSGDNAIVIALVSQGLAPRLRWRAVLFGTGLAISLRIVLSLVAGWMLHLPLLGLVAAALLLLIAIKLQLHGGEAGATQAGEEQQLWSAVMTMVGADVALSLDNVLALAATTRGEFWALALGLLASVPILMYGSLWLGRLMRSQPLLLPAGSALLGWIAGSTAVSDPLLADWVNTQAPAWAFFIPLLAAVYVLAQSAILNAQNARLGPLPRLRWRRAGAGAVAPGPAPVVTAEHALPESVTVASAPVVLLQAKPAEEGLGAAGRTESLLLRGLMVLAFVVSAVLLAGVAVYMSDVEHLLPKPERSSKPAPRMASAPLPGTSAARTAARVP